MVSTPPKDGGPAFPILKRAIGYHADIQQECEGLSLRDYFAAKAMQAAVSTGDLPGDWIGFIESQNWGGLAKHAYAIADAMLAEREKEAQP